MAAKDRTAEGEKLRKEGAAWLDRIKASEKAEKQWMDDADKAVKAYTGELASDAGTSAILGDTYDFNILFANVETIVPAVINSPPSPDIRRRFADDDPAAKDVAELLERATRIQVDDSKLQVELEAEAQDAFLAGRGVVRLRFKSDFVKDTKDEIQADSAAKVGADSVGSSGGAAAYTSVPDGGVAAGAIGGAATERLANERITFEAVSWRDYRHGPAKRWDERPWDAFRFCIPREDESDTFDASLIGSQTSDADKKARGESKNDLTGWEIWCKKTKKVKFIDDEGVILKQIDDPLGLSGFFCIATPVQPIEVTGRLMPVNPFSVYRKLADELDLTTKRINVITNHMKVKGWYSGDAGELSNMLDAADTDFIPIKNPELWAANGGLSGAVAFWPVEKFIVVLKELYAAREQTKQAIYEITGISDIVRGATKATETLGAQQIKTQWGSLRIQKMQRMMERTARDLFVMMAEIIPTKFSFETLQKMTGVQIIPNEQDLAPATDPQQAEAQKAKLAKLQGIQRLLSERLQTFYRIDVESDSTVKADLSRQKAEVAEFMQGAGTYFAAVGPLVKDGTMPGEAAAEIFGANARLFNLGKTVEDTIEKMVVDAKAKAAQPPQPSPEQQAAEADAKAREQEAQAKTADRQADMQAKQIDAAGKAQQREADLAMKREEHQMKMAQGAQQMAMAQQTHEMKMREMVMEADLLRLRAANSNASPDAKSA